MYQCGYAYIFGSVHVHITKTLTYFENKKVATKKNRKKNVYCVQFPFYGSQEW